MVGSAPDSPEDLSSDDGGEGSRWMTGAVVQKVLRVGLLHMEAHIQYPLLPESAAFGDVQIQEDCLIWGALHGEVDGSHLLVEVVVE